MNNPRIPFFQKLNDLIYIIAILALIAIQVVLRKFLPDNFIPGSTSKIVTDLLFNTLFGLCLFGFYLKKYNPDIKRKILMAVFLGELILGTCLKNMQISYHYELTFIGFLGVLILWINTHRNRKKFSSEQS